jgi:hypothetical protein
MSQRLRDRTSAYEVYRWTLSYLSLLQGDDTYSKWPPEFGKLRFTFEFRSRPETRAGVGFGLKPDLENPLFRTRLGVEYKPVHWLKLSGVTVKTCMPPLPRSAMRTFRQD